MTLPKVVAVFSTGDAYFGKAVKLSGWDLMLGSTGESSRGTEENHRHSRLMQPVSGPRYEPETSEMQRESLTNRASHRTRLPCHDDTKHEYTFLLSVCAACPANLTFLHLMSPHIHIDALLDERALRLPWKCERRYSVVVCVVCPELAQTVRDIEPYIRGRACACSVAVASAAACHRLLTPARDRLVSSVRALHVMWPVWAPSRSVCLYVMLEGFKGFIEH
jgi:hypothetical protein